MEIFAEFLIRGTARSAGAKITSKLVVAFGYTLFAFGLALISLYLFPRHFVSSSNWRAVNVVLTPLVVGWLMALRGRALNRKNIAVLRIDTFCGGWLFAFTFALTPFFLAH